MAKTMKTFTIALNLQTYIYSGYFKLYHSLVNWLQTSPQSNKYFVNANDVVLTTLPAQFFLLARDVKIPNICWVGGVLGAHVV